MYRGGWLGDWMAGLKEERKGGGRGWVDKWAAAGSGGGGGGGEDSPGLSTRLVGPMRGGGGWWVRVGRGELLGSSSFVTVSYVWLPSLYLYSFLLFISSPWSHPNATCVALPTKNMFFGPIVHNQSTTGSTSTPVFP